MQIQQTDQNSLLAPPRQVERLEDCLFYHTMDLPGFGVVRGQWDLRGLCAVLLMLPTTLLVLVLISLVAMMAFVGVTGQRFVAFG